VNDVVQLCALIDKKKVVVTEDVIRQDLRLDDADGVEWLPNKEIFAELTRMGHEKPPPKLTFYKAFFSAQWKFLINTLVDDLTSHNTKYTSHALTQMVLANMRRVGGKIEAIDADVDITLVDVETQVDMDAELQGMITQEDIIAVAIKDVSAAEPTVFDDEEAYDNRGHGTTELVLCSPLGTYTLNKSINQELPLSREESLVKCNTITLSLHTDSDPKTKKDDEMERFLERERPEYPEYLPPANDVLPAEEQPLPIAVSPTAESPGYIADSKPEMDPEEEDGDDEKSEGYFIDYPTSRGDDDADDDGDELSKDDADDEDKEESSDSKEEEEEHLAPTVPAPALHSSIYAFKDSDQTEPIKEGETAATPPPSAYRVASRISVRPHIPMPFYSESEVEM
nr:hypothetical protein [Tanacetum cinerariifolium]